jgi:hypothetical protein
MPLYSICRSSFVPACSRSCRAKPGPCQSQGVTGHSTMPECDNGLNCRKVRIAKGDHLQVIEGGKPPPETN